MLRSNTLVKLSTKVNVPGCMNIHARMMSAYLDTVSDLFTPEEFGLMKGRLRNNDLKGAVLPSALSRLDEARKFGTMTVNDFQRLYQYCSFMKKVPERGDESLCKETGFNKLLAGEESCRLVNRTIDIRKGINFQLFDRTSRIIQEILGDLPPDFLNTPVFFGPGSTVNVDNRDYSETGLFFKLSDKLIVPKKAVNYLAAHLSYHPNWVDTLGCHYRTQQNTDESRLSFELRVFRKHFKVVDNDFPSRIGFVPKNSDEHRTIGIEMNGLMILQKVIGNRIREALLKAGVNLNSQKRNRHLARLASTFSLSTIDLANASNSISLELVRALLPADWFAVISDFRSDYGHCPSHAPDRKIKYEMVSSMGNGFTFELESLIFYALAKASAESIGMHSLEIKRSIGVYGDDIIVPSRLADTLIENMSLFGFATNVDKTFINGSFFESCGADYYLCTDVRPFFLKREVNTVRDLFFVMNSLMYRSISQQRADFAELYGCIFSFLPKIKTFGPLHFNSSETEGFDVDTFDDLEATLRVPLHVAQALGGVKYDCTLYAWRYKKWIRTAVESRFSKSKDYFVRNCRYLTFLKGTLRGKVVLRGRTSDRLTSHVTSNWNGVLTVNQLRLVDNLFRNIPYGSTDSEQQ